MAGTRMPQVGDTGGVKPRPFEPRLGKMRTPIKRQLEASLLPFLKRVGCVKLFALRSNFAAPVRIKPV